MHALQNRRRLLIGPVVDDGLHDVSVPASRDAVEERPALYAYPIFDSLLPQQRARSRDDLRQIVKHTLCRWRRRQDASQQSALPAADIDNRRVGAEIVPGDYGGLRHL